MRSSGEIRLADSINVTTGSLNSNEYTTIIGKLLEVK